MLRIFSVVTVYPCMTFPHQPTPAPIQYASNMPHLSNTTLHYNTLYYTTLHYTTQEQQMRISELLLTGRHIRLRTRIRAVYSRGKGRHEDTPDHVTQIR